MMTDRPLFSAEINEIIGHPPHWVNRVGGTFLLLIIAGFVLVSAVIVVPKQYILPVVLYGQAKHEYLVKGTIDAGQLDNLKKAKDLKIEIPLDHDTQDRINLTGKLQNIIPPIKNGRISYVVRLNQASANILAGKLPEIESIAGKIIVEGERKTLMKSMLQ